MTAVEGKAYPGCKKVAPSLLAARRLVWHFLAHPRSAATVVSSDPTEAWEVQAMFNPGRKGLVPDATRLRQNLGCRHPGYGLRPGLSGGVKASLEAQARNRSNVCAALQVCSPSDDVLPVMLPP